MDLILNPLCPTIPKMKNAPTSLQNTKANILLKQMLPLETEHNPNSPSPKYLLETIGRSILSKQ